MVQQGGPASESLIRITLQENPRELDGYKIGSKQNGGVETTEVQNIAIQFAVGTLEDTSVIILRVIGVYV